MPGFGKEGAVSFMIEVLREHKDSATVSKTVVETLLELANKGALYVIQHPSNHCLVHAGLEAQHLADCNGLPDILAAVRMHQEARATGLMSIAILAKQGAEFTRLNSE